MKQPAKFHFEQLKNGYKIAVFCDFLTVFCAAYLMMSCCVVESPNTQHEVIIYAENRLFLEYISQIAFFAIEIKINKMLARPGIEPVTLRYQKMHRHSTD